MSDPKTALVTGANKGIGHEIVRQLLAKGLRVFLTARNAEAGQTAVRGLQGDVQFLQMDVSDDASIENAATTPREQLVKTFQTNTFAPLAVTQAFLPFLKKSSAARIINISSGYGEVGGLSHTVPSYCLSKLTLNGVTIMLDQALRSEGIAVYVMCPGWVRTDMGGANASRSVEEGADTAVWLAIDAPQSLSWRFFRDRTVIGW
jgi:NAD(P)-dependent dehydrogenase (short-subunit alcohol dehydrogenase family)